MPRVLRFVLAGTAIAAGVFAAVAAAATKTITITDKDNVPKCVDIDRVVANAGATTVKFKVTMAGSVKAKPCNGTAFPSIALMMKTGQCSTGLYTKSGQPSPSGKYRLLCEGGPGGRATISISPGNDHQWDVEFATSELPGQPSQFGFTVSCGVGSKGDGTLDATHNKYVNVKIG
jgi:hypothetical protein